MSYASIEPDPPLPLADGGDLRRLLAESQATDGIVRASPDR